MFVRGEKCGEYKFSGRKSGRFWGKDAFFEGEESPAGGGKRTGCAWRIDVLEEVFRGGIL